VDFWRRVVVGFAMLALKALVFGVIYHYILSRYRTFLEQYEGAKEAFTYFASQASAECVSAILPFAGSWVGRTVERAANLSIAGRCVDPTTSDSEEFESLTEEEATR